MSFHRFVYLCGWTAVALLAIVGFAAFSADTPSSVATSSAIEGSWGQAAGAVSGQGWLALAGTVVTASVVSGELDTPTESSPIDTGGATATPPVTMDTGWLDSVAVRDLVETFFASGDVNRAVRLAWCVSRFDIDSINPSTGAAGLFQIDPSIWSDLVADVGLSGSADIFDPAASTQVAAYIVYQGDGWAHWDCDD